MRTANIIKILKKNGYNATVDIITKCGKDLRAIVVGEVPVRMVFYIDDFYGEPDIKVAEYIMEKVNTTEIPDINSIEIINWDFVKGNIRVGLRPITNDKDTVTRRFLDLEEYCYCPIDRGIIKINQPLLEYFGIPESQMFKIAEANTAAEAKAQSIFDAMCDLLGEEVPYCYDMPPMFMVSNKEKYLGAGTMTCINVFETICEKLMVDVIKVIPSSIHELLVVPAGVIGDDEMAATICSVNDTSLSDGEYLGNHPYTFIKGKGFV